MYTPLGPNRRADTRVLTAGRLSSSGLCGGYTTLLYSSHFLGPYLSVNLSDTPDEVLKSSDLGDDGAGTRSRNRPTFDGGPRPSDTSLPATELNIFPGGEVLTKRYSRIRGFRGQSGAGQTRKTTRARRKTEKKNTRLSHNQYTDYAHRAPMLGVGDNPGKKNQRRYSCRRFEFLRGGRPPVNTKRLFENFFVRPMARTRGFGGSSCNPYNFGWVYWQMGGRLLKSLHRSFDEGCDLDRIEVFF